MLGVACACQRGPVAAVAHDDQLLVGQLAKGLHGQVDALVGNQPADDQIVVAERSAPAPA